MNNPPLNALSHALRSGIVHALDRALADAKVRAIVIIGNERAFSSGADIKEFSGGAFYAEPFLPAVVDIVEAADKPVIAAISGACMGGGLELALGCHYRVALADAKIAFPEVKLGLIPGAGGTQRFPRLVGLESAVNMIVSGATVPAVDVQGHARCSMSIAHGFARRRRARIRAEARQRTQSPIRRVRDLPVKHPQAEAFLQFAKTGVAAVSRGLAAPLRALEAVGAAVDAEVRCGHRDRAEDLRRAHGERRVEGVAPCVLRRARGVQGRRSQRQDPAAEGRLASRSSAPAPWVAASR